MAANALCEVCMAANATVVCCADEAAMCASCDTSVHSANKLASKHTRLPFMGNAGAKPERPPCDICQQAKALFVCREDRAYLCRSCDLSVHSANAAAESHERWLLNSSRVALHPPPDAPSQPLNRAAAVKAAAAARAAAAEAAAAAAAAARAKPAAQQQQHARAALSAGGVQRVPSMHSLDVSLGMGDLFPFGGDKEPSMVSSKLGSLTKGLGSIGDLTSLFDVNAAAAAEVCVPPAPEALLAAKLGGVGGATGCGVDTPPLSGCSDGEALLVPDGVVVRVPKRART